MTQITFPDPSLCTNPEGIIAIGGDLSPENLIEAYSKGIFPWPMEGVPLLWFCPPERGILEFSEIHRPRSLERAEKKSSLRFTLNQAFRNVIEQCSSAQRPGQDGTWITREIQEAYINLHTLGIAHSIEAWRGDALVGGLYGVSVGGMFAGESMFHLESNASKLCILFLANYLQARGLGWMDIQVMTPHMKALGARLISREEFLKKLKVAQAKNLSFPRALF